MCAGTRGGAHLAQQHRTRRDVLMSYAGALGAGTIGSVAGYLIGSSSGQGDAPGVTPISAGERRDIGALILAWSLLYAPVDRHPLPVQAMRWLFHEMAGHERAMRRLFHAVMTWLFHDFMKVVHGQAMRCVMRWLF
eukprot:782726-Pelagomonas_calceolata.AAC.5